MLMYVTVALFILTSALANASDKSISRPASQLKMDTSRSNLTVSADGKIVQSTDCQLSDIDAAGVRDLILSKAPNSTTSVSIDLAGIAKYCELRKLQYECLYNPKVDGCSENDFKKVETGEKNGLDWLQPEQDLNHFVHPTEPSEP